MRKSAAELASRWLRRDMAHLSTAEQNVLRSAAERTPLSRDTNRILKAELSLGDRMADSIARIGGSWNFIVSFLVFLAVWTTANMWLLGTETFDPYPFVFLNLVLSMIAALQAPIIMMSQNRQAEHDRIDATHDYEVNLKAEIEIMALHEKLDEMRHQEMVAMREDIRRIAEDVARLRGQQQPDSERAV